MNKLTNLITYIALIIGLLMFQSCVKDDDYSIPPVDCTGMVKTMNFDELISKVDASTVVNNLVYFNENAVIEGYVISSDEAGNFYKTISLQNSLSNPTTKGLQIEIDQTGLYTQYPIGSLVQVQLNGLVAGYDRGVLKIGSVYKSGTEDRVGRMAQLIASTNVKKSCNPIGVVIPRVFNSISEALKPEYVNTLVTIKNVQFQNPSTDVTYGDAIDNLTVNRKLIDKKGRTVDLRNSGYARWADTVLPTMSGEITVVVSVFSSNYQLFISDLNDVKFNQPRFEPGQVELPSSNAVSPFLGANFNNWSDFIASTGFNTNGIPFVNSAVVIEKTNLGINNSTAMGIEGQVTQNGPIFIVRPTGSNLPINPTKLHFWIKGTSAKSLNIYVYKTDGTGFYTFNVGALTEDKLVSSAISNSYTGIIDTNNDWKLVQLDLEGLTDINTTDITKNFLSFRIGNNANYNLLIDNITIE